MKDKIIGILREYIFILSIITIIFGIFLLFIGMIWIWFKEFGIQYNLNFIKVIGNFNYYIFVIGLIALGTGIYYLYSFIIKRKFVLEEIQTNKRSELLKRHNDLKESVRYLPSKYKKLLKEKEKELRIK